MARQAEPLLFGLPRYLASFGIFWFFITLSVESSVVPIKDVMFEHRVYLRLVPKDEEARGILRRLTGNQRTP